MKKLTLAVTIIIILIAGVYAVMAEKKQMDYMDDNKMMKGPMCPMCMMAAKSMMEPKIVPFNDGGVVILIGNKLISYDDDLEKQNEVTVEIDYKQIRTKMMDHMKNCPMCRKMMDKKRQWMEEKQDSNDM